MIKKYISRFLSLDIQEKKIDYAALAFPANDSELLDFFNYRMILSHQTGVNASLPMF